MDFIPNCYSSLNNLTTAAIGEDLGIFYIAVCALNRKCRSKIRSQRTESLHKLQVYTTDDIKILDSIPGLCLIFSSKIREVSSHFRYVLGAEIKLFLYRDVP